MQTRGDQYPENFADVIYGRSPTDCQKKAFAQPYLTKCNVYTLWGVRSVVMFCSGFFRKFRSPIGLYSSCTISPTACGTQKCSTKRLSGCPTVYMALMYYAMRSRFQLDTNGLQCTLTFVQHVVIFRNDCLGNRNIFNRETSKGS